MCNYVDMATNLLGESRYGLQGVTHYRAKL